MPNFSSVGWFSFSSVVNSCYQLLTAVDNWWQLAWKKCNWYFYVYTKVDTCAEFQPSRLIFIFISCQQLLSAVDSWYEKKLTGVFMFTLVLVLNFNSLAWFLFSSAVNSCYQILTAGESWYERFNWNYYVHMKVDTCAKFQLSKLIFLFTNCYQLLTADMKKITIIFICTLKFIQMPNFSSLGLFSFSSLIISWYQLLTAVDSCWQLMRADMTKS